MSNAELIAIGLPQPSQSDRMSPGAAFAGLLHLTVAAVLLAWPAALPTLDEAPAIAVVFTPPPPAVEEPPPLPQPQAAAKAVPTPAPAAKPKAAPLPQAVQPAADAAPTAAATPETVTTPAAQAPEPPPVAAAAPADLLPSPVEMPRPTYPLLARRKGWEGVVLLMVEVNELGCPNTIQVKRSSGYPALDEAAMDAAKRWHFDPARKAGRIVTATVEVPIRFSLKES
ncbi:MAG: energy transducer TonB [Magnetospirillum sp.]|nr:energy transducer TonB [Magnetospirillum sp.]